ncbi:MAG: hypothetical protein JJU05_02040 [Verrucomicrobia bacterium]|nr:hypothetical protein [Verrucomicrobiota bacterium]
MGPGYFSNDVEEFLSILSKHQVEFLIVGGEAVIFHGHARLTGDIDVFYNIDPKNLNRLYTALGDFWGGDIPGVMSPNDFKSGEIIQFGMPPNRIDLLNQIDGVSFSEAWENRIELSMMLSTTTFPLCYIGKAELRKNKLASGRPKDLQDLLFLEL